MAISVYIQAAGGVREVVGQGGGRTAAASAAVPLPCLRILIWLTTAIDEIDTGPINLHVDSLDSVPSHGTNRVHACTALRGVGSRNATQRNAIRNAIRKAIAWIVSCLARFVHRASRIASDFIDR